MGLGFFFGSRVNDDNPGLSSWTGLFRNPTVHLPGVEKPLVLVRQLWNLHSFMDYRYPILNPLVGGLDLFYFSIY